jgi:hypothetical protein
MPYMVDLAPRVEEALEEIPANGRHEVMEVIATVLVRPESWPAPGGRNGALRFGRQSWVAFTAYGDGIEVYDVGWAG